jgi:hypothetical protein
MRKRFGTVIAGLTAGLAASAALGLAVAGTAMASPAKVSPAITPACTYDSYCSDPLFNVEFGVQFVVNNANWVPKVGNNIDLQWANDNKPSQDWRVTYQYPVFVLYRLGLISAAMNLHYHFRPAFESMWAPYGVSSNLCRGLARTAYQGEPVTLQPCGAFPRTLWVVKRSFGNYGGNALINGSTNNPSVPYVMTAGGISGGTIGNNSEAQLRVFQLQADDGLPDFRQLWCTEHETFPGQTTPTPSPSVGPPTIGPPTFVANQPCFPGIRIGSTTPPAG